MPNTDTNPTALGGFVKPTNKAMIIPGVFYAVKKEEIKSIREYLPEDFLNLALYHVIYNKCAFAYSQKNWKVVNCYFTGATLCLDIKDESRNITDVITICTDNTFGFFVHYDICKRSKMLPEEIDKTNIIRKSVNKKEYK